MTHKLNSQKEAVPRNKNLTVNLKLFMWSILLAFIAIVYYFHWLNTVSVINKSDYKLRNVIVYKPRWRMLDVVLWKGEISANSKKTFYISSGGSDAKVILEATWQGKTLTKEDEYAPIGSSKFKFTISKDGRIVSQVKEGYPKYLVIPNN